MSTIIDGSVHTELYVDENAHVYQMLQRKDGSISLYYTKPLIRVHFVILDTRDAAPSSEHAQEVIARITELHDAIGALLAQLVS
jgi:hypothetical protein